MLHLLCNLSLKFLSVLYENVMIKLYNIQCCVFFICVLN